jgi:hypothetical protein
MAFQSALIKGIFFAGINPNQGLKETDSTSLMGEAKALGYQLVDRLDETVQRVICVDWDPADGELIRWLKRNRGKATLVMQEPSVVIPQHSQFKLRRQFSVVLEVGRPFSEPTIPWPQTWESPLDQGMSKFSDKVVLIQSAKYSFVKGQLYSLRIYLASTDKRVDVFGHGWDESPIRTSARLAVELLRALRGKAEIDRSTLFSAFRKPLNYIGSVDSKISAMDKYKVAVVIENSQGYMSEKLFDAFFARCIPVYVGAELEPFGIPDWLYVKADPTQEAVSKAISYALSMDYESWRSKVDQFLDDPLTRNKWDAKSATRRILELALGLEADRA